MRKSRLTDGEILELFKADVRVNQIADLCGMSRQAVWAALKRTGEYNNRHGSADAVCRFCGETYRVWRNILKKGEGHGVYCSIQCFHADRSIAGEYSMIGGSISRVKDALDYVDEVNRRKFGRAAWKAIQDAGIVLKPGEVVHHRDGNRQNNSIDNLRIFKNQSEHMKFHHSLRNA